MKYLNGVLVGYALEVVAVAIEIWIIQTFESLAMFAQSIDFQLNVPKFEYSYESMLHDVIILTGHSL